MIEAELHRSIVENANELITVFDRDGVITFVNGTCRRMLGYEPSEIVGKRIVDFVHPDDRQRAESTLRIVSAFGTSEGTTHFRLLTADGFYRPLEMTSGMVGSTPVQFMTMSRPAGTRFALDAALRHLLEDRPLPELMPSVCELFAWRAVGSHVAVSWQDGEGIWNWVGTEGCPSELSGRPMTQASAWMDAIGSGRDIMSSDAAALPRPLRELAERFERGGCWIGPVTGSPWPAAVSIWTRRNGHPPLFHAEGMQLARQFMRLVLRWADQHARLDHAASFDDLTGLPNRASFFRALSGSAHGAILYCDLDRFKPVNDVHGHAAGDEVLRQVARRLRDSVRAGDTVARIGGDEFAIICPSSTAADASALADRISAAVEPPIAIGEGSVQVGISIGIAHTTDRLDAASVAAADKDLYAAKAARRK
ncbi:MAG: sensor domain-containing diguanylate cyclase [Cyanobacteria bacterium]|nr:sensor domain-containing diguanylate cyclase [Cyanobacteriota bacterium]